MTVLRLSVLGRIRAWVDGTEADLGPPQQRAMLALLVAADGRPMSMNELVTTLWAEDPPASAVNIVQRFAGRLRRTLEPALAVRAEGEVLVRAGTGYRLDTPPGSVDLALFREHAHNGEVLKALALWKGLDEVVREQPVFQAIKREYLGLVTRAADEALTTGTAEQALPLVEDAASWHPLDESLQARLILLLAAAGRQALSLLTYAAIRRRLADELGVQPGPELQAAHLSVLRPAEPERKAQLPPDVATFAGRQEQLAELEELIEPSALVVTAIGGMAGIGKTTLAVHLAHRLAPRFPDGQFYLDLRGFHPSGAVVTPAEALGVLLDALGVPPKQIPDHLDKRAALFRTTLTGRRVLLLLDNVRDAEQVLPLLPGAPGCLAVVTSRDTLGRLVAAYGAYPVALDLLAKDEARDLLASSLGASRVAADPEAADEIVRRCGRLPLALAVVAARAAADPRLPLAAIARELGDGRPVPDARDAFSWSLRALSPEAVRLFTLLALHPPGGGLPLHAAAALAGEPVPAVRFTLAELGRASLLSQIARDRFGWHDLLHAYAKELLGGDTREPFRRLLVFYIRTLAGAIRVTGNAATPAEIPPAEDGVPELAFADAGRANAWIDAELSAMTAAVGLAAGAGLDRAVVALAETLAVPLDLRGRWRDSCRVAEYFGAAAERLGDGHLRGRALLDLASALYELGDMQAVVARTREASGFFVTAGNVQGQLRALRCQGAALGELGRPDEALAAKREALAIAVDAGEARSEALIGNSIAWSLAVAGDHAAALRYAERALQLLRAQGNDRAVAATLDTLGYITAGLGDHGRAAARYTDAAALSRTLGDHHTEAVTLDRLGTTLVAAGDETGAHAAWSRAHDLLSELDPAHAEKIGNQLLDLGTHRIEPH